MTPGDDAARAARMQETRWAWSDRKQRDGAAEPSGGHKQQAKDLE